MRRDLVITTVIGGLWGLASWAPILFHFYGIHPFGLNETAFWWMFVFGFPTLAGAAVVNGVLHLGPHLAEPIGLGLAVPVAIGIAHSARLLWRWWARGGRGA